MREIERRLAQEAKAMTRQEVMKKALGRRITRRQAADLLGIGERQVRRLRRKVESKGLRALKDDRAGRPRRKRIPQSRRRGRSYQFAGSALRNHPSRRPTELALEDGPKSYNSIRDDVLTGRYVPIRLIDHLSHERGHHDRRHPDEGPPQRRGRVQNPGWPDRAGGQV